MQKGLSVGLPAGENSERVTARSASSCAEHLLDIGNAAVGVQSEQLGQDAMFVTGLFAETTERSLISVLGLRASSRPRSG